MKEHLRHLATMMLLGSFLTFLLLAVIQNMSFAAPMATTHHVAPGGYCGGAIPCYATLQAAVDAADPGDEIKIAKGDYTDVSTRHGIIQAVYIAKPVTLHGGYTTTNWITPDPAANPTTLDAQGQGRVVVISDTVGVEINGLNLTGGDATDLGGYQWGDAGGGVYVYDASVTIRNSQISTNTASSKANAGFGGGVYFYNSKAVLDDNTIYANTATDGAGGVCLHFSAATLDNNTISANLSSHNGGGVFLYFSPDVTLSANLIISNTADERGGGVFLFDSDAKLTNNAIIDNHAGSTGGGLHIRRSSPHIMHSTIASNHGGDGSGVHVDDWNGLFSAPTISNTIITSHTVGIMVKQSNSASLNSTLWHENENNREGGGLINHYNDHSGNPAFAADGYHLTTSSAAINKGIKAGVLTDIDGEVRPLNGGYDLGVDEFDSFIMKHLFLPMTLQKN